MTYGDGKGQNTVHYYAGKVKKGRNKKKGKKCGCKGGCAR